MQRARREPQPSLCTRFRCDRVRGGTCLFLIAGNDPGHRRGTEQGSDHLAEGFGRQAAERHLPAQVLSEALRQIQPSDARHLADTDNALADATGATGCLIESIDGSVADVLFDELGF